MKWVLVRSRLGTLYVLEKDSWCAYSLQAVAMGQKASDLLLESDDRDELVRFKNLTEED